MRRIVFFFVLSATISSLAIAQRGDRKGHDMQPPPAHWKIPPAPVLTAERAIKSLAVEDGFEVELVAAEPMIHDPVALAFDGNGRIWVAEMRGYMPNIDGKGEDVENGRIVVLEDTDNDGSIDKSTVFLDKLVMPRAVALGGADKILQWANGSTLFETEINIANDGTISAGKTNASLPDYAHGGNPEHKENGFMPALDNWRYNSKSDKRYKKIDGKWVNEKTESRGQWGISQDNYGRLFTNTNSNFVTADALAPGLSIRNKNQDFTARKTTGMKDQKTYPSRINPGVNRGYIKGTLTEDGYLYKPTAASGLAVYRGDQFPSEYSNSLFLNEPGGNLVKRALLKESPEGGYEITPAYEGSEFFTSTDERSRIVNCFTAPDGTIYLVDFYRGIIQHAAYVTSYLRAQYEERALDVPVGLGRIWRVRHTKGKPRGEAPKMQQETSVELVAHLSHPNGWWRDTAQRLIVERGDKSAVTPLRKMLATSDNHLARVHAAWTLEGLGELAAADVAAGVKSDHPWAVAETIRASDSFAGDKTIFAALTPALKSKSIVVQRQLAASLGLHGEAGVKELAKLMAGSNDQQVGALAISSASGHEAKLLAALPEKHGARRSLITTAVRAAGSESGELAASVKFDDDFYHIAKDTAKSRNTKAVTPLLAFAGSDKQKKKIREGMLSAAKDKKFKKMSIGSLPGSEDAKFAAALFTTKSAKEISFLKTAQHKKQFTEGKANYARLCIACHMPDGKGQLALAPPLINSEWVSGPDNRLIAIIMDGAMGPIHVNGKKYEAPAIQPLMPGLRANPEFTDADLASVMTYIRNDWGNGAKPISAEQVKSYRDKNPIHAPFTEKELKAIK